MENFVTRLICVVTILAVAIALIGKMSRGRFEEIDGAIVAQYPMYIKLFTVFGYSVIAILPLVIASSLKEGNPIVDRLVFVIMHGTFLVMILWTFNRRIVVGEQKVGTANIFGNVRIIGRSELVGAQVRRKQNFIPSTVLMFSTGTIAVDDHMENCASVVQTLLGKSRIRL